MNISLRRGEKIYINGAVVRVDRKVCIELLNDVSFLLENHVMQASDATTPLKQLYFVIQMMLISPNDTATAMGLCRDMLASCRTVFGDVRILDRLVDVQRLVQEKRYFDALKILRPLFLVEGESLADGAAVENEQAA
jgi:flagellar protein FlbT